MNSINRVYNLGYLFGRISSHNIPESDKQEICDFISDWYEQERGAHENKPVRGFDVCA